MHSTADLWCIQCHVNPMTLYAQSQNNALVHVLLQAHMLLVGNWDVVQVQHFNKFKFLRGKIELRNSVPYALRAPASRRRCASCGAPPSSGCRTSFRGTKWCRLKIMNMIYWTTGCSGQTETVSVRFQPKILAGFGFGISVFSLFGVSAETLFSADRNSLVRPKYLISADFELIFQYKVNSQSSFLWPK